MFPYLSIDIETSGLNSETCQILEFAAVYDDGISPVEELPSLSFFVGHPQIVGEPYALAMNKRCLDALAELKLNGANWVSDEKTKEAVVNADYLIPHFNNWFLNLGDVWAEMQKTGERPKRIVAGKNFASFDLQFLNRLPQNMFRQTLPFHFKYLDAGNLWLSPSDEGIPSLSACLERAGLPPTVSHCALDDAFQVVQLVRAWRQRLQP